MNNIPKQYLAIGVIVLLLLVGGFMYTRSQNMAKEQAMRQQTDEEVDEPIPTVDPDKVKVTLEPEEGNRELMIAVNGIPEGTESIDYELSYNTVKQGLQGIIGTIEVEDDDAEKQVTLGTCSSGTCVYHDVDGPIKVSLLFSGSYGEQVYEDDFNLDE